MGGKIKKLGRCQHCKELVSRRCRHTWRGKVPQWVYLEDKRLYYHKHCWEEIKKSRVIRKKLVIESPSTPIGKITYSGEGY